MAEFNAALQLKGVSDQQRERGAESFIEWTSERRIADLRDGPPGWMPHGDKPSILDGLLVGDLAASPAKFHAHLNEARKLKLLAEFAKKESLFCAEVLSKFAEGASLHEARCAWRDELEASPIYRSLQGDPNFALAREFVSKAGRRRRPGKYGDEFADVRLMHVAVVAQLSRALDGRRKAQHASRVQLDSVIRTGARLLKLLESGMRFGPFTTPVPLRAHLSDFMEQVTTARQFASRNKPRAEPVTCCVDGIIQMLMRRFGEASPTLVQHIAAMLDIQFERRNIERRIAKVRKRNKVNALALRAYRNPDRKMLKSPKFRRRP